ncbi:hypothetical protein ACFSTH_08470 [Paenibacillus yanchengensis]|uniref:Uncharacterized protein n=1 Tax=Paenibacillus yanchengensis TaxID=2035833 RepID=A0ABW4YKR0_9BACL
MAILKDINGETVFEFKFVRHFPGEFEGSKLKVKISSSNGSRELVFGWMNITLNNFIALLKDFPGDKYDRVFDHSDENFELKWLHEYRSDLYVLFFVYDGFFLPHLKVSREDLRSLGNELEEEMRVAPTEEPE